MTNEEEQNTSLQPTEPLNTPPNNAPENTESTNNGQSNGGEKSGREWLLDYWNQKDEQKQQKQPNIVSTPQPEQPKVNSGLNDDTRNWLMDYWNQKDEVKLEQDRKRAEEEQEKVNRRTRQSKLHEGLERQTGDSYDAWTDSQYEFIKGKVPSYLGELPDEDEPIKEQVQDILNDSWEFFNSKSNLAKNMRTGITKELLDNGSFNSMASPIKMMNELSDMQGLYWVALNSDNPERRKRATKRINELQDKYDRVFKGLDDDSKKLLKGQILFSEYYDALAKTMQYPGDATIYITPRAGDAPLVTSKETGNPGEYKMTLDEFRSDMLKLAMGKQTDSVGLKSGFIQTKRYKNGDIYSFDFNDIFDPMRYIKLSENDKEKLRKEGLNIYYHDRQEEIKKELQNINGSILALARAMLSKDKTEREAAEKELKALEQRQQELQEQLKHQQDKYDQAKAEQEAIDLHRAEVAKAEQDAKAHQNKIQEDFSAKTAVDSRGMIDKISKIGLTQAEVAGITSGLLGVAETAGDVAAQKAIKALQTKFDDLAARWAEAGVRQLDKNVTADWLEEAARIVSKSPALKVALKAGRIGIDVASGLVSAFILGKEMYDSWKNAETFYEQLKDPEKFDTYLRAFDESTQKYIKDKMTKTGQPNMLGFYQVQLDDQLPKATPQEVTNPEISSLDSDEVIKIKAKLRSTEVDIIHSAVQGYTNRTGKDKKFNVSKDEILKMLGIPAFKEPVTDKEIKMMESSPWLLPFYKSLHPSTSSVERLRYLKSLSGNRELNKMFKEFER